MWLFLVNSLENWGKKLLVMAQGKKTWLKPGIGGTSELSLINR